MIQLKQLLVKKTKKKRFLFSNFFHRLHSSYWWWPMGYFCRAHLSTNGRTSGRGWYQRQCILLNYLSHYCRRKLASKWKKERMKLNLMPSLGITQFIMYRCCCHGLDSDLRCTSLPHSSLTSLIKSFPRRRITR